MSANQESCMCKECEDYKRSRKGIESPEVIRNRNSLSYLTSQFILTLLQVHRGNMDLNHGAYILNVHKRRLYDITNALQGVGILAKTSKNVIQYRGNVFQDYHDEQVARQTFDLFKLYSQEVRQIRQAESLNIRLHQQLLDMAKKIENFSVDMLEFEKIIRVQMPPNTGLYYVELQNQTEVVLMENQNGQKIVQFTGKNAKPQMFRIYKGQKFEAQFQS